MPKVNYYELLGVSPDASAEQIEAAFKRRARKYHPKLNPDDQAAALVYQRLCKAFRILTNPQTRQQYDRKLREVAERSARQEPSQAASATSSAAGATSTRPFRPPSSRSPVQQEGQPGTAPARRAFGRGAEDVPAHILRRRPRRLRVRRLVEGAKKLLWWGLSAATHVLLIWLMARLTYAVQYDERTLPPMEIRLRPDIQPERLEIGQEIVPEEPEDIELAEVEPDPVEIDPVAMSEVERQESQAMIAVEGGGPYRLRSPGGRARAVQSGGATAGSENAVNAGLRWLKENQLSTGAWRADREGARWADAGITGLATLAFLGAGHTQQAGQYRRTVGSALGYLKGQQDRLGCITLTVEGKRVGGYMYNHGIATLALTEAYAMTEDPLLREASQRAVDFIVESQNSTGGWRYYATSTDADSSVSGWMVMALRSAKHGGLEVPKKAFDGARKFFESVTDKGSGATSYMTGMPPSSPALIAVGLLCNQYLGLDRNDPYIDKAGILINKFPPEFVDTLDPVTIENLPKTRPAANSYYFWYYANLALHQRRDEAWEQWHPQVRKTLVQAQVKEDREAGSWPPASRWAKVGGRVYSTALAVLSLEVYYRYAPIYKEVVDEVLAAYGRALTAYNEFAGLARAEEQG